MKKEKYLHNKGYKISEDGLIINPKGNILKGCINSGGYRYMSFRHNGRIYQCQIHRLQAYQKYGNEIYVQGTEVRHLNGDKSNNSSANIKTGTSHDNHMDIPKEKRMSMAMHATSFVRKHNKEIIKPFYEKCKSYKKTMDEFGISSKGTLHFILNG